MRYPDRRFYSHRWLGALARHRAFGLAGIVDEDGFQFGKEVQTLLGHLAVADSCGLDAAEGQLVFAADGRLVDMDHAGFSVIPTPLVARVIVPCIESTRR